MAGEIGCADSSKEITPPIVRDAIIACFVSAHSEILDMMKEYHEFRSKEEFEEMEHMDVEFMIKSMFKEMGADFDNPTKKDLKAVIDRLAEYAANFRKPDIIKKHYDEMLQLINRLQG